MLDDPGGTRPVDVELATRSVFAVLNRHLTPKLVEKVKDALPEPVRSVRPEPGPVPLTARAAG